MMRQQRAGVARSVVWLTVFAVVFLVVPAGLGLAKDDGYKVPLCHRTGSVRNPYVLIRVGLDAVSTHYAHGDLPPHYPLPGMPGMWLTDDCSVVNAVPVVNAGGPGDWTPAAGAWIRGTSDAPEVSAGYFPASGGAVTADENLAWVDGTYQLTALFVGQKGWEFGADLSRGGATTYVRLETYDPIVMACPPSQWDTITIQVRSDFPDRSVELNNVNLNLDWVNYPLGSFSDPTQNGVGATWTVSNFIFTEFAVITGDLVIHDFSGGETIGVEVLIGCSG